MTPKLDPIAEVALPRVAGWVHEQAAREGVPVAVVLERALAREQARAEGRRVDNRSKHPGRRGMDARVPDGHLHGGQLATAAGVERDRIDAWRKVGAIASAQDTRRGIPAVYGGVDVLIGVALGMLEAATGPLHTVVVEHLADRVRAADRTSWRGVSLVAHARGVEVIGDAQLGPVLRDRGAAAVVSMEAAARRVATASLVA